MNYGLLYVNKDIKRKKEEKKMVGILYMEIGYCYAGKKMTSAITGEYDAYL